MGKGVSSFSREMKAAGTVYTFNFIACTWELEPGLLSGQFGLCSQALAQNNKSWGVVYW